MVGAGCPCTTSAICAGICYNGTCSSDQVEGVAGADLRYSAFNAKVLAVSASDSQGCGKSYSLNGKTVMTKCYMVNNHAQIVFDEGFMDVSLGNTREYDHVFLGYKEGAVMKDLITKGFFIRHETKDFQGHCRTTPYAEAVNTNGLAETAAEKDDLNAHKGRFARLSQDDGCIQDVSRFEANSTILSLASGNYLKGSADSPCGASGEYILTAVPGTSTYFIVIKDWTNDLAQNPFNFGCHISRMSMDGGAYKIINGTCVHEDQHAETPAVCAAGNPYDLANCQGTVNAAALCSPSWLHALTLAVLVACLLH